MEHIFLFIFFYTNNTWLQILETIPRKTAAVQPLTFYLKKPSQDDMRMEKQGWTQ